jgi:hypothetical protein
MGRTYFDDKRADLRVGYISSIAACKGSVLKLKPRSQRAKNVLTGSLSLLYEAGSVTASTAE